MSVTSTVTLVFGDPVGHYSTDETTEQWLADVTVNLDDYDDARFALSLAAAIKATGGAIPTFKVYMRGVDVEYSPVVLTLTPDTSPATWTSAMVSAARVVGHGPTTFSLYAWKPTPLLLSTTIEINAAALTLGFGDADPAPRPPGPTGGDDIWLDQVTETGDPEYAVTNAGDWASVSGRDAVQQSLMRRFFTKPGDYLVDPSYGAGLLAAVKSRMRQTDLDAIARRLRQQALADRRVRAVSAVTVSALSGTANGLKYSITVDLVADGRPMTFGDEVT